MFGRVLILFARTIMRAIRFSKHTFSGSLRLSADSGAQVMLKRAIV